MKVNRPFSSGAIIKCNRELVLYQRCNKAPSYPNKLAVFGGKGLNGENHKQSLIRELGEEIKLKNKHSLVIKDKHFQYLGLLVAGIKQDHDKHIYLVEIPKELKDDLKIGSEGRKIVFLNIDNLPKKDMFVPDLKTLIFQNRKILKRWLDDKKVDSGEFTLVEG